MLARRRSVGEQALAVLGEAVAEDESDGRLERYHAAHAPRGLVDQKEAVRVLLLVPAGTLSAWRAQLNSLLNSQLSWG